MRHRHAAIPTITTAVVAVVHTLRLRVRRAVPRVLLPVSQVAAAALAAILAVVEAPVVPVVAAAPEDGKYKYVFNFTRL